MLEAGWAPAVGLVFARCGGLLAVAPPLNVPQFPVPLRLGVAGVLALALAPTLSPPAGLEDVSAAVYAVMLLREAALGALAGFAAALVFWGFLVAGQLLDRVLDSGEELEREQGRGPLTGLVYLLAAVGFVAMNGHHRVLAALADGLRVAPIGAHWTLTGVGDLGSLLGVMLWSGVAMAAPVLLAIYAAEVALAAFERVAPGLGLAEGAPAVRWTSGLLALMVCIPLLGEIVFVHGERAVQAISMALELLHG